MDIRSAARPHHVRRGLLIQKMAFWKICENWWGWLSLLLSITAAMYVVVGVCLFHSSFCFAIFACTRSTSSPALQSRSKYYGLYFRCCVMALRTNTNTTSPWQTSGANHGGDGGGGDSAYETLSVDSVQDEDEATEDRNTSTAMACQVSKVRAPGELFLHLRWLLGFFGLTVCCCNSSCSCFFVFCLLFF